MKTIYQKLLTIQQRVNGLGKDKSTYNYKYVTGDKLLGEVKPMMNELGLLLKQEVLSIENTRQDYVTKSGSKSEILSKVMMKFTWIDTESGEQDENLFGANGQNDWEKGLGSALTYAERYFILKSFNIPTGEDDPDAFQNKYMSEEEKKSIKDAEEAALKARKTADAEKRQRDINSYVSKLGNCNTVQDLVELKSTVPDWVKKTSEFHNAATAKFLEINPAKPQLHTLKRSNNRLYLLERTAGKKYELLIPTMVDLSGSGKPVPVWITVNAMGSQPQVDNMLKGQPFTFNFYDMNARTSSSPLRSDDPAIAHYASKLTEQLTTLIKDQFRNVQSENLNSSIIYTDPVTGKEYRNGYYEFITETNAITTDLPGSKTMEEGQDSSYSFYNAGVHLAPFTPVVNVEGKDTGETVIIHGVTTEKVETPGKDKSDAKTDEELLDEQYGKNKPATVPGFQVMSPKEIEWFTERFGEDALEIIQSVDRVIGARGIEAFGYYHNALVRLAEFGEVGTTYHEAFHFVFDPSLDLISARKRRVILEQAAKVYGKKEEAELEELLAEDFRLYVLSNGKRKPEVSKAKGFFNRLLQGIKNLLGLRSPIEKLFKDISNFRLSDNQKEQMGIKRSLESPVDPKYRLLPGFKRSQQQEDAIEATANELMAMAAATAKKYDIELLDVFTSTDRIKTYMEEVRKRFEEDLKRIDAITENERVREDKIRKITYSAMGIGTNPTGTWEDTKDFADKAWESTKDTASDAWEKTKDATEDVKSEVRKATN